MIPDGHRGHAVEYRSSKISWSTVSHASLRPSRIWKTSTSPMERIMYSGRSRRQTQGCVVVHIGWLHRKQRLIGLQRNSNVGVRRNYISPNAVGTAVSLKSQSNSTIPWQWCPTPEIGEAVGMSLISCVQDEICAFEFWNPPSWIFPSGHSPGQCTPGSEYYTSWCTLV